jgi:HAD superfamily hydrolase (TIGR01490 family)
VDEKTRRPDFEKLAVLSSENTKITVKNMNLALFDLDHTLLPIDSDYTWCQFLIKTGILNRAEYQERNDRFYTQYQAGTLDIYEFLSHQLKPLAENTRKQLDSWHERFMQEEIEPHVLPQAVELVQNHLSAGDDCILVTATNSFVTRPIATRFGIAHLIGTEPEALNGEFTGGVQGTPSFREGKVTRTHDWLSSRGKDWSDYERIYFYSDSINDLPLLEKATHPVATNPDDRLAAIAQQRNWSILKLFE